MKIKDLYKWAIENHVEDCEIGIQYQDKGGAYFGNTHLDGIECNASIKIYKEENYVLLE